MDKDYLALPLEEVPAFLAACNIKELKAAMSRAFREDGEIVRFWAPLLEATWRGDNSALDSLFRTVHVLTSKAAEKDRGVWPDADNAEEEFERAGLWSWAHPADRTSAMAAYLRGERP